MDKIYKIISFLVIGLVLAYLSCVLNSSFAKTFADNILALFTTLFAINIASSTLIASKLKELEVSLKADFSETKKELKVSFYEQMVLIAIAFLTTIIRDSKFLETLFSQENICLYTDTILFACFVYFMDVIRDLGKALFTLLD